MTADRVLRLPTGEVLTIRRTGYDTGGAAFEVEAVLPPGLSGPPLHRHRAETETFTVVEGSLRVRVGRRVRVLTAGESVTVPPGTVHGFANPSDRPARIRTVETPAGPLEAQFRALAAAGRFAPLRRLARINVEHDLSFTLHGIPDAVQRPLWRALAKLPVRREVGGFADTAAEARFRAAYDEAMAWLPPPAAIERVATAFGRVHVYRFGDGDGVPLVLLPGRGGTTAMWAPNLPAWATQRTVFAVEVLGEAGLSVQDRPIRSAADQAAWLAETLQGLGLERAHLVGVSSGGWLAANLALHDPRQVASLALVEPVQVFDRFPPAFVLASLGALPAAPDALRDRVLRWFVDGASLENPGGQVTAAVTAGFRSAVPPPRRPTDAQLRSLRVPTLVVIGGRSRTHRPRRAYDRARSLLPDVEAELWPEGSHALSGQCAEQLNTRVLEFIADVEHRDPSSRRV